MLVRFPAARLLLKGLRRSVDAMGSLSSWVGLEPRLDPDDIIRRARKRTGLHDLGDVAHPDGFSLGCASAERDAGLGAFGRLAVRNALVDAVSNRLRYVHAKQADPKRFHVPLRPPIFVVGLPRSGTTFLHRLLCSIPNHRGIPMWESRQPIADQKGKDKRRDLMAWAIAGLRAFAPEVMTKHAFELDSPEEAVTMFEASMGWNPFLWRLCGCHSYLDWLLEQDATEPYRIFVDLLHWIAAPEPASRLVLKTPNHVGFLDTLHQLLPDAIFVQTHRDPASCVPSYASLSQTMHGLSTHRVDLHKLGSSSLKLWSTLCQRAIEARAKDSSLRVIDVDYNELIHAPMDTVQRVYAEASLPWDDSYTTAIDSELQHRTAGKYGKHHYNLEDFGLTEEVVRQQFAWTPKQAPHD